MPEVHPEVFYPEVPEGLEGVQTERFWARLEGPADYTSGCFAIQVACAFETFCKLVNLGDLQNPQAPLRDILQAG
jgi:hypothetical protein